MPEGLHKKRQLSSFQAITLGFAGVILMGAFLLMLPISSAAGVVTPFNQAVFTSTSAVCVTGLVLLDTGSYWSPFGQGIILLLIQIGGLGVITVASSASILSGRRISLSQRSTMQDAISAPQMGGIVKFTRFLVRGTFTIELIGALLLLPVFCHDYGPKGIWMSFFHSISAFCNAGFDLFGTVEQPFVSLSRYLTNPYVNGVIILLIVLGGIGFLTWDDIRRHGFHLKKYRMQSKVILTTSLVLIVLPTILYFLFDFQELSVGQRFLAALFQAVTPRTAGFNTADLTAMTESSRAIMIFLMLIGGSPGSTAGGMKTTTLAVLVFNAIATFRKHENPGAFGRRLDGSIIKNASSIAMMYFAMFFTGGILISVIEKLPLSDCLFESASAVGTVGLTLGITPTLHLPSQIILIILMYLGRVGGLTIIYAALAPRNPINAKYPMEKITVG
ncbi:MAG: potassium transporter TrkG [Agathobacter sp.]|nr:potassium transporter TrkG [Agathobacter sp.]